MEQKQSNTRLAGEPSAEITRKVVTVSRTSKAAQRLAPSERTESRGVAHVSKSGWLYRPIVGTTCGSRWIR